jgi:hypothetical protein
MSEPTLIQQQRDILRALRQARTQHAQIIAAADAQWQQVQRAYDEVQAQLTQLGEAKLLTSVAAAPPAAPPAADPAEAFHRSAAQALTTATHLRELLRTPPFWQPSATWNAHKKPFLETIGRIDVTFSPDGRLLASGSVDKTVKVWEAASGRLLHTLSGHTSWVFSVAFSPDGALLASGSTDKTVKVWEAATGRLLHTLSEHTYPVTSVAFSPDGRLLASGSGDHTVRLWSPTAGGEG